MAEIIVLSIALLACLVHVPDGQTPWDALGVVRE